MGATHRPLGGRATIGIATGATAARVEDMMITIEATTSLGVEGADQGIEDMRNGQIETVGQTGSVVTMTWTQGGIVLGSTRTMTLRAISIGATVNEMTMLRGTAAKKTNESLRAALMNAAPGIEAATEPETLARASAAILKGERMTRNPSAESTGRTVHPSDLSNQCLL